MSRLNDQLAAVTFDGDVLGSDEVITDVVITARVMRMSDGRSTVLQAASDGIDTVTYMGLVECSRQIAGRNGWETCDDEEDE